MDALNAWIDGNLYVAFGYAACIGIVVACAIALLIRHVDSGRPISRREWKHYRGVQSGKRAQAGGR